MDKTIICTVCPLSCEVALRLDDAENILQVLEHTCARGEEYARAEHTHPVRTLTTTVRIEGALHPLLPVRTDKPIPKGMLLTAMQQTRDLQVKSPVAVGEVIVANLLGTGANLVASRSL